MANVKITDLAAYTDPASTDVLPIVDVGADVTKKVSIADLLKNAGSGTESLPGIAFDGDPNTGIYSPGADQVAISTSGTERVEFGTSEVVFNDGGENYDFRIEGDTNSSLFFVDASAEAVGIGTTSPLGKTHIQSASTGLADVNNAGDELVIENSTTAGMTILSGNTSACSIYFADSDSPQPGGLQYDHSDNSFNFRVNNSERARIDGSGRLLVGTSSQSGGSLLQVNDDRIRVASSKTPASASDTGTAGEICWDSSYIYVCTATDTWKRAALSTW